MPTAVIFNNSKSQASKIKQITKNKSQTGTKHASVPGTVLFEPLYFVI
jgi:hypothetical protein